MKYGKIFTYENKLETDKLIGKKVLFSDSFKAIHDEDPEQAYIGKLDKIGEDLDYPFQTETEKYQFIREIIEEELKYRPFKPEEMKLQVGKIVVGKSTDDWLMITRHDSVRNEVHVDGYEVSWSAKELFNYWTFTDGTPCGVKEE